MTEYEYCLICAEKYKERGNLRMYRKYINYAVSIKGNGGWK